MMPCELLLGAGQKSRHIDEGNDRNVEAIAKAHEPRALHRRVDIEASGEIGRLIGDDADGIPADAREADQDVCAQSF